MEKFNSRSEILRMIQRYVAGRASDAERKFLETYYDRFEREEDIFQDISDLELQSIEAELKQVLSAAHTNEVAVRSIWLWLKPVLAAASVIIILFAGFQFFSKRPEHQPLQAVTPTKPLVNDIAPGGNIALLTLADGTRINLDKAANGKIASQAGWNITKENGNQLIYSFVPLADQPSDVKSMFNRVETPRGGEYQVILPDGTRVWLNAASSLRFPAVFTGQDRRVQLKGEAYFEVAPNKEVPFLVESNGQLVEVLGTHFNVDAYPDDRMIKTTLLEGSVRVSAANNRMQYLNPGEQAVVRPSRGTVDVRTIDPEEAIAWKNGYFLFNNENIQSIMRKISRWYNVEIEYKGKIPAGGFGGNVSKAKNISEVLRILELTEAVHFKVEGRRVTVMP